MVYKRKRANGTEYPHWYFRVKWRGREFRQDTRQGSKRVAMELENDFRVKLAKGEAGLPTGERVPTLKQFATEKFVPFVEMRSAAKPATVSFYKDKMNELLAFSPLGNAYLDRIDEKLIERFVQYRRKSVSPATVNRGLATLKKALRLANSWKIIRHVPKIQMLDGERVRDFVLSADLEPKYLAACPEPLKTVATLILETGLRASEAITLQYADLNLKGAEAYLQIRSGKSKAAKRSIPLTAKAAALLRDRPRLDQVWVFPAERGGPLSISTLDHQHQRVRDNLNLSADFTVHSLRHTFGTRLGEKGCDLFTLKELMGHSHIGVTQRYVHPSPPTMRRAIGLLEEKTGGSSGDQAQEKPKEAAA